MTRGDCDQTAGNKTLLAECATCSKLAGCEYNLLVFASRGPLIRGVQGDSISLEALPVHCLTGGEFPAGCPFLLTSVADLPSLQVGQALVLLGSVMGCMLLFKFLANDIEYAPPSVVSPAALLLSAARLLLNDCGLVILVVWLNNQCIRIMPIPRQRLRSGAHLVVVCPANRSSHHCRCALSSKLACSLYRLSLCQLFLPAVFPTTEGDHPRPGHCKRSSLAFMADVGSWPPVSFSRPIGQSAFLIMLMPRRNAVLSCGVCQTELSLPSDQDLTPLVMSSCPCDL